MTTRKAVRLFIAVGVGTVFLGCAQLTASYTESISPKLIINSKPLEGMALSASDAYSAAISSTGGVLSPGRYTMSGNGDVFGTIDVTGGVITFQRPDVTGPCTNGSLTAPSCGFTWGSGSNGVYHGGDYNLFPNSPSLSNEFQYLKSVRVDVHHELATGDLSGGMSDCGLNIGFGTAAGAPAAPQSSNNLRLPGRSTSNQDMVKFTHRYTSSGEQMLIEAPLNNSTDGSYTMWGLASYDTSFNMSEASMPSSNGDYVDFRMWIVFDHVMKTATIRVQPLATNKNLSLMQSQTVIWNYDNPHNATSGGEARGGLMFGSGTNPLSLEDFEKSRASLGFLANGVARKCQYSNIQIGTLKKLETVSTPYHF